jgi:hypothetical protein
MKIFISSSKDSDSDSYEVKFLVRETQARNSVLGILAQMNVDTTEGHGSMYIADAEGDDATEHYLDGDGSDYIGKIKFRKVGGPWKNLDNRDFLKRGKFEFVKGVLPDGTSLAIIKDRDRVVFKGREYILTYSKTNIYLEDDQGKVKKTISWKNYLHLSWKDRDKLFTRIDRVAL